MGEFAISVIIPMYNAEEYVENSINSILKQSLKDIEIICIDDGSTDSTIDIIEAYQSKHSNICLFKQNHSGSGPARNLGIQNAKGKYISFLDADDFYYDEKALELMINACEEQQVLICGSYRKVCENEEILDETLFKEFDIPPITGRKMLFEEFQGDYHYQSFIFNRELLVSNNIYFPDYLRYQDPPFFLKALIAAKEFWVMPVFLYCYRFGHQNYELIASRVHYILMGIRDNLKIAIENDYETLYKKIIERLNVQYMEMVLQNLSDKSLALLLEISQINQMYSKAEPILALDTLYSLRKNFHNVADSNDVMRKIVKIQQGQNGFKKYFDEMQVSNVVVYGLGEYGKILINILEDCRILIKGCVDKKVKEYKGYSVYLPEDELPECDMFIVSLLHGQEIAEDYKNKGIQTVVTFSQIVEEIVEADEL